MNHPRCVNCDKALNLNDYDELIGQCDICAHDGDEYYCGDCSAEHIFSVRDDDGFDLNVCSAHMREYGLKEVKP